MKEEDDMLELLDEEDMGPDSSEEEELELTDESTDESFEDSLGLEDQEGEPDSSLGSEANEKTGELEEEGEAEPEGIVIDIKYIAIGAIAILAILIGVVFLALPMMADNPPQVSFSPSQADEDLLLTHLGKDSLSYEFLTVLINGAPAPADKYQLMGGSAWPWIEGVVMRVDTTGYSKPASVTLVYKPKSLDHVLYGTMVEPTPTPTPTPTPIVPPAQELTPESQLAGHANITPGGVPDQMPVTGQELGQEQPVVLIEEIVDTSSVIMSVEPVSGHAPLTVECADQTNGCIRNRVWNFGDGQTSMKRNPTHVYPFAGVYDVTLDVRFCDPDDDPSTLPRQTVTVIPSVRHDTLAQGTGTASILSGGKMYFTVKGPGTNIRIAGRDHYLNPGDNVMLTLGSGGEGEISVISQAIVNFNFSNVTMTVNGDVIETGSISVININQYLEFETADLTVHVSAGKDGANGMVDAQPVISAAPGQQIIFNNVGIDSTGKLLFNVKDSAGFTFRGGIESYEVLTPPPL